MVYNIAWDESLPDGDITPAEDLDTEIQNLKTSLRERLEQVIPGFGDDMVDPKLLISRSIYYALGEAPITTSALLSEDLDLTEKFNSGEFTKNNELVEFDKAGKYLAFFGGSAGVTQPDGGEQVQLRLLGTASIATHSVLWVIAGTTSQTNTLFGMTFVEAALGEHVFLRAGLHNSTGSNPVRLDSPSLFLYRLGD